MINKEAIDLKLDGKHLHWPIDKAYLFGIAETMINLYDQILILKAKKLENGREAKIKLTKVKAK